MWMFIGQCPGRVVSPHTDHLSNVSVQLGTIAVALRRRNVPVRFLSYHPTHKQAPPLRTIVSTCQDIEVLRRSCLAALVVHIAFIAWNRINAMVTAEFRSDVPIRGAVASTEPLR
jgi:hypothetical protein